jgi:amino acid adenylation domain-containing protein
VNQDDEKKFRDALRLASAKIKEQAAEIEALKRQEPVAVIGMGCRFPGAAADPDHFWRMLEEGASAVTEIPADRWDVDRYFDPIPGREGRMYARHGAFIEDAYGFDAGFFGITPREAESMDPQQRLLLEISWRTLEDAGIDPASLRGSRTGVFVGMTNDDYIQSSIHAPDLSRITSFAPTGTMRSTAAGRLSYTYDLRGPSLSIDTACSSSLVAIHHAIASLERRATDLALAGGVNLMLSPSHYIGLCQVRALSPDGLCRAFAAGANGYVRGEGCGLVLLKRFGEAQRDGDRVLAVIRGSAINHDGRSNGLTAPNGLAQEAVIAEACAAAGVAASALDTIEAHGTGTELGDPIEIRALANVIGRGLSRPDRIPIGSVKTNIGHLESAAGVASLIKVILALRHERLPASLHFDRPNPHIDWSNIPFEVVGEAREWKRGAKPRIAGISSFGFSGTNAHLIVEEAPYDETMLESRREPPIYVIPLSARTDAALAELAESYRACIDDREEASRKQNDDGGPAAPRAGRAGTARPRSLHLSREVLDDICYTAAIGRSHFEKRRAAIGATPDEILLQLAEPAKPATKAGGQGVAILFAGQGAEYAGMAARFYETRPVFREAVERCNEIARGFTGHDFMAEVFRGPASARIQDADFLQPCLFAIEYGLLELWRSLGVRPAAVCGYSLGEFTAAYAAGIISVEDCLRIVCEASLRIAESRPGGLMASVVAPIERVSEVLRTEKLPCEIAADNSPWNVTLAGSADAVRQAAAALAAEGIVCQELPIRSGFHSSCVDALIPRFRKVASEIRYSPMQIPFYSTILGRLARPEEIADPEYWIPHMRRPVLYRPALEAMRADGFDLFLECDPGELLVNFGRQADREAVTWIASLRRDHDDERTFCEAVGALYELGSEIDWKVFHARSGARRVSIPGHPFRRETYRLAEFPDGNYAASTARLSVTAPSNSSDGFSDALPQSARALAKDPRLRGIFERQRTAMAKLIAQQVKILEAVCGSVGASPVGADLRPAPTEIRSIIVPVSSVQRRMYAVSQSAGGELAYHLPESYWISGPLDADRLECAFQEVVRRHESLRTGFRLGDEDLVQCIEPDPLFAIERMEGEEERIDEIIRTFIRPFDLERPPLIRVGLARIAPTRHLLIIDCHHIIMDFASFIVLVEEMTALYEGRTLPPVARQYRESAQALEAQVASPRMKRQEEYWLTRLAGDLPVLELPTDASRPMHPSHAGGHLFGRIGPALTAGLKKLARETETTLFMILFAAYSILLHRLSGQEEVIVGVPVGGRNLKEARGVVGMFVNSLPARQRIDGSQSVREFLGEVKRTCLGLYDNQDYPFQSLVEKLAPPALPGRNMIFDTMLELDVADATSFHAGGLAFEYRKIHHRAATCDLVLQVLEHPNQLVFDFNFATDLFSKETIARWSESLETILASFVEQPSAQVDQIDVRSEAEKTAAVARSRPSRTIPADATIHGLFARQVAKTPDAVALVHGDRRLSYRDLDARANRMARALRKTCGIKPDDLVALLLDRSEHQVIAILAVLKAGAAYVPIDPESPRERIEYILEDSRAKALIAEPRFLDLKTSTMQTVIDVRARFDDSDDDPGDLNQPADLAYVIYTSGSTGKPKGCLVTHHNVARLMRGTEEIFGFNADDVWPLFHSYAFDFSVWEIWGALLYGGKLVVVPYETSRSPEKFRDLVARERVTVLNQTPSAFRQFIVADRDSAPHSPPSLRYVIFGGEALEFASLKPWFDRYGDEEPRLVNMYGITETTVHVTHRRVRASDLAAGRSLIGIPLPDLYVRILDERMMPVPLGAPGEIYVGWSGLARGYHRRPELTRARFVPDPLDADGSALLYKSGDLGRYLPNGEIEYLGRGDQQVKIRGFRIECGEVETALRGLAGVRDAVVVTVDEEGEKALAAYCVTERIDPAAIRGELRRLLPDHMIPSHFVRLDRFPLTSNGKLDRKALPDPRAGQDAGERDEAPLQNEFEEIVAGVWKELLRIDRVGRDDNFIELGGDSIKAIQAVTRLRRRGLKIDVADLLKSETVATIAARFAARPAVVEPPARSAAASTADPRVSSVDFACVDLSPDDCNRLLASCGLSADDVEEIYPLMPLQAGMLYHSQADRKHLAYLQQMTLRLSGRLDAAALARAFQETVDRHETLRTLFAIHGAREPLQVVLKERRVDAPVNILDESSDDAFERIKEEDRNGSFDPLHEPLMRMRIVSQGSDRHAVLFTFHHIILDGWSFMIVLRDLFARYGRLIKKDSLADEPSVSLRGFVEWFTRRDGKADLEFWQRCLAGLDPDRLPLDPLRTEAGGYSSARHRITLPPDLTERLQGLVREGRVTLNSLVQSAWALVMARHSGLDDFALGMTTSGRPAEVVGVEKMAGLFINTVPVRYTIEEEMPFADLLAGIHAALVEAQERQYTPLGEIMAACRLDRLIDHAVVFENYPLETSLIGALEAGDLGMTIEGVDEFERSNFDLLIVAYPGRSLVVEFTYNGEVLSSRLVERFGQDIETVFKLILDRKEIPLGEILARLLPNEERSEEENFMKQLAGVDEEF